MQMQMHVLLLCVLFLGLKEKPRKQTKRGLYHNYSLAIYIKKYLSSSKTRIMETQIFHPAKI